MLFLVIVLSVISIFVVAVALDSLFLPKDDKKEDKKDNIK